VGVVVVGARYVEGVMHVPRAVSACRAARANLYGQPFCAQFEIPALHLANHPNAPPWNGARVHPIVVVTDEMGGECHGAVLV
jgi:hypothetical protein